MHSTARTEAESVLRVSVIYALPADQHLVELDYAPGLTAIAAVELSGLVERFPEIRKGDLVLGIFGRPVSRDTKLRPGDRVEISRPLVADPRTMRRELLTEGRVMGGAESRQESPQVGGSSVRSTSTRDTRPSSK